MVPKTFASVTVLLPVRGLLFPLRASCISRFSCCCRPVTLFLWGWLVGREGFLTNRFELTLGRSAGCCQQGRGLCLSSITMLYEVLVRATKKPSVSQGNLGSLRFPARLVYPKPMVRYGHYCPYLTRWPSYPGHPAFKPCTSPSACFL